MQVILMTFLRITRVRLSRELCPLHTCIQYEDVVLVPCSFKNHFVVYIFSICSLRIQWRWWKRHFISVGLDKARYLPTLWRASGLTLRYVVVGFVLFEYSHQISRWAWKTRNLLNPNMAKQKPLYFQNSLYFRVFWRTAWGGKTRYLFFKKSLEHEDFRPKSCECIFNCTCNVRKMSWSHK